MVIVNLDKEGQKRMGVGKYELGRTLGEGNFGKVKFARNTDSGQPFAVKILEKKKIIDLNTTDQIKREIASLKLLKHPNVVRLHEIFKGDVKIPKWLSSGAQNMIKVILDPNPKTRITISEIKEDPWFKEDYNPANHDDEDEDINIHNEALSINEVPHDAEERSLTSPTLINAFQLIGMSSCLDLSNFFEKEDVSERNIRFTSNLSAKDLIERIEDTVTEMGFRIRNKNGKLKVILENKTHKSLGCLSVATEVFEISPSLYVVELRKSYGDASIYRQLCKRLSNDLGVPPNHMEVVSSGSQVN
ncbi:hypothetical protein TanjilG_29173 [Lupinus angustifolius]|uniref:non-specific serine/threonine protein kinase n=1 Tax=Lupinus angustifolius TaxID=3871 RepID=A0A1J7GI98_LUPAN|nr:hypothetical protein TanjilG_29173 [Lupinus angustifolius]